MKYKFRAWDTVMRDWVPMGLNCISEQVFIVATGRSGGFTIDTFDSEAHRFIVMQFIGLHDKNGKEMYGGDIVEGNHGVKAIIEWSQEFGRWSMRWSDGSTTPISWHVRNATVIGKVHEHSDLLK